MLSFFFFFCVYIFLGRWLGLFQAFVRQEASWNNFNYIEKSIVFNKAMYVLSRTGKIDSWTYEGLLQKNCTFDVFF
jgi:hypothetical protein